MVSKIRLPENTFLIAFIQFIHMCQVMSEYMNNSCTRVLGYLGTQGTQSLEYLNTRALKQLGTQGTQALGHSWHFI